MSAEMHKADSLDKERRPLTKTGKLLRRPLLRWCQVENGELVYFKSQSSTRPRGRIQLQEVSLDEENGTPSLSAPPYALRLIATRGPCLLHLKSQDEQQTLLQYLQSMCARSPSASSAMHHDAAVPSENHSGESRGHQEVPRAGGIPNDFEDTDVDVDPLMNVSVPVPSPRGDEEDFFLGDLEAEDTNGGDLAETAVPNGIPQVSKRKANGTHAETAVASPHENPRIPHENPPTSLKSQQSSQGAGSSQTAQQDPGVELPASSPEPPRNLEGAAVVSTSRPSATQAYNDAMSYMWNYDLKRAEKLLEPYRQTSAWHAGAYAECTMLQVVLTGRRGDVNEAFTRVAAAEALLNVNDNGQCPIVREGSTQMNAVQVACAARDLLTAELLLLRSGLQMLQGSRIRSFFNLHQSWCLYRRLENLLQNEASCKELVSRMHFGLGLFYLATSLVPRGIGPLLRLAGFLIDRDRGKQYLHQCAANQGSRATLAAVILALYHLDLEPDVAAAGDLLMEFLRLKPECVLLHWAASVLAWRHSCISDAVELINKALWCCGEDLGKHACYLRYELGMFHFMDMAWSRAQFHLRHVHDSVTRENTFMPHKTLLWSQLAAVEFAMGQDDAAQALCEECMALEGSGSSMLERDFVRVIGNFLQKRTWSRLMLAFEVMYLLRQFSRLPAPMLEKLHSKIKQIGQPYATQFAQLQAMEGRGKGFRTPSSPQEIEVVIEHTSTLMLRSVVLFHLGDLSTAMGFVRDLAQMCPTLPSWCSYLTAHGLYWAGRIMSLSGCIPEAVQALRAAKGVKKYAFNINTKICKVLQNIE